MSKKGNIAIVLLFLAICFSGCTGEYWQAWSYSSYKLSEHKVKLDSAYVAKYGGRDTNQFMNSFPNESWIKDSVPYLSVTFEKKHHELFLLLVSIIHQRKREKFGFQFSIYNHKNQIKSLDSVFYSISDSSTSEKKTGKFIYGRDFVLDKERTPFCYLTSYSIDFHPKKRDTILADFEVYYTDIHNKVKMISVKNLKSNYFRRWGYWYTFAQV